MPGGEGPTCRAALGAESPHGARLQRDGRRRSDLSTEAFHGGLARRGPRQGGPTTRGPPEQRFGVAPRARRRHHAGPPSRSVPAGTPRRGSSQVPVASTGRPARPEGWRAVEEKLIAGSAPREMTGGKCSSVGWSSDHPERRKSRSGDLRLSVVCRPCRERAVQCGRSLKSARRPPRCVDEPSRTIRDVLGWRTAVRAGCAPVPRPGRFVPAEQAEEAIHLELPGANSVTPQASPQVRAVLAVVPALRRSLGAPGGPSAGPAVAGSVARGRRTARARRFAEGPAKVVGGAGPSAAWGAPAPAGSRAGTPPHRPPVTSGPRP